MRRIAFFLVLLAFALPAFGQDTEGQVQQSMTFKQLLSGTAPPLAMQLKDLNGDWRRMSVSGAADIGMGGYMSMLTSMFSGMGVGGVYYTRGDTVTIGSETYIIAYSPKTRKVDFAALMHASTPPAPEKLTPDTTLTLSLLNQRTIGSLTDIQPFDINEEIGASETVAADSATTTSLNNLKQITAGLLLYAQDYDEVLPPIKDPASVKQLIQPYLKNVADFTNPITHQLYQVNLILSAHKLKDIPDPAAMVLFYEDSPAPDNTRGVAFLDGHVKRIPETQWPALKRLSKISLHAGSRTHRG